MKIKVLAVISLLLIDICGIYNYTTSIDDTTKEYINNLLGITEETEYYVSNLDLTYIFLNLEDTTYLNELDYDTTIDIIYAYALHNELIDSDTNTTFSISQDNLNDILFKYNLNKEYDYTDLQHNSGYVVDYTKVTHDLEYKKKSNTIIVKDNLTIEDLQGNTINKTITYTFMYNDNYYLYSINNN